MNIDSARNNICRRRVRWVFSAVSSSSTVALVPFKVSGAAADQQRESHVYQIAGLTICIQQASALTLDSARAIQQDMLYKISSIVAVLVFGTHGDRRSSKCHFAGSSQERQLGAHLARFGAQTASRRKVSEGQGQGRRPRQRWSCCLAGASKHLLHCRSRHH